MKAFFLGVGLLAAALSAHAENSIDKLTPVTKTKLEIHQDWLKLAANDTDMGSGDAANRSIVTAPAPQSAENDWFTPNKIHKYLGLGSLGLATLAILAPKPSEESNSNGESSEGGIHHDLAVAATALGAAAVATGFAFHYKDLDLSKGFKDPDNLHMLLGTVAELAFLAAVNIAPSSSHAGVGALGAVAMATAIKIEW